MEGPDALALVSLDHTLPVTRCCCPPSDGKACCVLCVPRTGDWLLLGDAVERANASLWHQPHASMKFDLVTTKGHWWFRTSRSSLGVWLFRDISANGNGAPEKTLAAGEFSDLVLSWSNSFTGGLWECRDEHWRRLQYYGLFLPAWVERPGQHPSPAAAKTMD